MKQAIKDLVDIPASLKTVVVFDQSLFVKGATKNLLKEAGIGLFLTDIMILVFLGNPGATFAVLLSIPLSALVCLLVMKAMGGSINTMLLGGLALAFSRLIDDSVVVLENIFRYMEMGSPPREAAEKGGMEVSLAVLAATDDLDRVLSGEFSLRREQVHLCRSGAGRRDLHLRVVHLRDDRGPSVLRPLHPH